VPTYDLAFARKVADVAGCVVAGGLDDVQSRRVVAYLGRLSMELALKAFLEQAGLPVENIRKHSHNLRALLAEVDHCEVEIEIVPGVRRWVRGSRLRALEVTFLSYATTAGTLLEAEDYGASQYPNEIRYGDVPKDFPPEAIAMGASRIADWVQSHWGAARR